jgi:hypothetical protein
MLEGGIPILADGIRTADINNPKGITNTSRSKRLDRAAILPTGLEARGKAVGSSRSSSLAARPTTTGSSSCSVICQVLASQAAMHQPSRRGAGCGDDEQMLRMSNHLKKSRFMANRFFHVERRLSRRRPEPAGHRGRINGFLGGALDVERMAAIADPALYRNRRKTEI